MPEQRHLHTINFFKITVPGVDTVGLFMSCDGLEMSVEVMEYAEGGRNGAPHHLPGRITYPHITLSRGLTDQDALLKWFNATRTKAELKEITIELINHANRSPVRTWSFVEAFPVRWTGPRFAAGDTGVATESLEIAHGGLSGV